MTRAARQRRVGEMGFGKASVMKQTGEPLTKWARRTYAVFLPLWVLLAIGSLLEGNHVWLAISLTWVAGSVLNLWRDRRNRRPAALPPAPER
jgi:Na+-driven multidrug efflux pump